MKFLKGLALVFLGAGIGLFLTEMVLRLFDMEEAHHYGPLVQSGVAGQFKPNREVLIVRGEYSISIRTNSLGYRDDEPRLPRPKGSVILCALGDSFAFGDGVQKGERLTELLESDLAKNLEQPVEITNLGFPGTGTAVQAQILKRLGSKIKPNFVILFFFTGNDFLDNYNSFVSTPSQTTPIKNPAPYLSIPKFLMGHSHLWRLMMRKLLHYPLFQKAYTHAKYVLLTGEAFSQLDLFEKRPSLKVKDAYRLTFRELKRLKELCDGLRAPLWLVLIPSPLQCDESLWKAVQRRNRLSDEDYDPEIPNGWLLQSAKKLGIPAFSLLGDLRQATRQGSLLFYPMDGHWTKEGHRISAQALHKRLLRQIRISDRKSGARH